MGKHRESHLSRRQALKVIGFGTGTALLASCGATPTPTPAPTPTARVVEVTKVVEKPVTQVVEKPVTQVVEKLVTPTPAPIKPVVLRYQNHWTKEADAHYQGMQWLYKEFHAKYPGITINNVLNPDSIESDKKIVADCAAGDCPDIIHGASPDKWAAGYLLDMTSYIENDPAWKQIFMPDGATCSTEGHVWGLTFELSPMPTIWNMRILNDAGVSAIPKTWDELLAACDKIKKKGKLATSWGVGGVHAWHNIVMSQKGGREALAQNRFDAPQILEAFKRMKVFVDNKWIPDNEIELTWQQSLALWVGEKTAFYLNGAWTIGNEITSKGAAPDLKNFVKFVPFPAVGENGTTVEIKVTTCIGLAKKLAQDATRLDAAIKFMKFWFSSEGGKQWILLTRSPMAVKVDVKALSGVDPLLVAFLAAQDEAKTVYSLPSTRAMLERGWDDCWSGLQALMAGKSAEDALKVFLNEMSKYR